MLRYETAPPRATLTIDDPERRNPLSAEVMAGLRDGVDRAAADPEVRVIVITGAGDRAFSAGGDLAGGFVDSPLALHGARGALADLFRAMRAGGKPTVARVNGHALAGGFGLAAACTGRQGPRVLRGGQAGNRRTPRRGRLRPKTPGRRRR